MKEKYAVTQEEVIHQVGVVGIETLIGNMGGIADSRRQQLNLKSETKKVRSDSIGTPGIYDKDKNEEQYDCSYGYFLHCSWVFLA